MKFGYLMVGNISLNGETGEVQGPADVLRSGSQAGAVVVSEATLQGLKACPM